MSIDHNRNYDSNLLTPSGIGSTTIVFRILLLIVFFLSTGSLAVRAASVSSTTPSQNDLGVSTTSTVSATFSVDMESASFVDSAMVVVGQVSGNHTGGYAYNSPSRTVTFTSDSAFTAGARAKVIHQVTVLRQSLLLIWMVTGGLIWYWLTL